MHIHLSWLLRIRVLFNYYLWGGCCKNLFFWLLLLLLAHFLLFLHLFFSTSPTYIKNVLQIQLINTWIWYFPFRWVNINDLRGQHRRVMKSHFRGGNFVTRALFLIFMRLLILIGVGLSRWTHFNLSFNLFAFLVLFIFSFGFFILFLGCPGEYFQNRSNIRLLFLWLFWFNSRDEANNLIFLCLYIELRLFFVYRREKESFVKGWDIHYILWNANWIYVWFFLNNFINLNYLFFMRLEVSRLVDWKIFAIRLRVLDIHRHHLLWLIEFGFIYDVSVLI